ncbi:phage antirepressor N-terminal domain-containing protein [Clostridium sp. BJN0013]|uniref:phage antirepressor N-terminal domain-containing protein n=1 Tax=Clostridium sp. BJN0013 TaxID=3236840 RepID=UPI0034C5E5FA
MSNLITKQVNFHGDNLMAAKDKNTGKIYTGVSYICRGIGLTKDQKDRQVKNVQSDLVLNRGCVKFGAGVFDLNNPTLAMDIDFLPLWLAKISITPKKNLK